MFATPRKEKKGTKSGTKGGRKALTPDEAKKLLKELVPPETPKKAIPTGLDIPDNRCCSKHNYTRRKGINTNKNN